MLKPLIGVLALALVLEEWLWDKLKAQLHRISHWPWVHRMEVWLAALPPWASLLVLVIPGACLLPFKLAGVWALAHGHPIVGLGIFVAAKMVGTALAAYLFDVVRDKARELVWFDRLYCGVIRLLQRAHAWLEAQTTYKAVRAAIAAMKQWLQKKRSAKRRRSALARRLAMAKSRVLHFFK